MKRILHVISGLGTGGAETTLSQLAAALARRGWDQHIVGISEHDDHAQSLRTSGIEVTVLGLRSLFGAVGGILKLRQVVRRFSPSVIQGWMYHGDLFAALGHIVAGGSSARCLLWNLRASNMDAGRYAKIVRGCALLSRWPDAVVANSKAGAKYHVTAGYSPRRIEVIPNGIDVQKFRPDISLRQSVRSELGIGADEVVAIHVARVDPMKDHTAYLKALQACPMLRGVLVGRGTENLAAPSNAIALGPRADLPRLYAASDIVISTSAFGEGFSNVIAEGMSCGLVPVATDVGDAAIIMGDTGHLVPPRDSDALQAVLATVLEEPMAARHERGLAARKRIAEHFSIDVTVQAYVSLYESVMR